MSSGCHSAKVFRTTVGYFLIAIATDLRDIGLGAWQTVYAMLCQFLMTLQTLILSAETQDFPKEITDLKSFNSMLYLYLNDFVLSEFSKKTFG